MPILDVVREGRRSIEALSAQAGLKIMRCCMEEEIVQQCGRWGSQTHYRHGTQPGYVVFHGRKVPILRPRLRDKSAGAEATLESYRLFQKDGRMQRAVARQLVRQVSTRTTRERLKIAWKVMGSKKAV